VDNETRRKKQRALMATLLERKIRLQAQRFYDERGQAEGSALEDWLRAEADVLGNSILAPLYRKSKEEFIGAQRQLVAEGGSEAGA
jgi:hypothetical protein